VHLVPAIQRSLRATARPHHCHGQRPSTSPALRRGCHPRRQRWWRQRRRVERVDTILILGVRAASEERKKAGSRDGQAERRRCFSRAEREKERGGTRARSTSARDVFATEPAARVFYIKLRADARADLLRETDALIFSLHRASNCFRSSCSLSFPLSNPLSLFPSLFSIFLALFLCRSRHQLVIVPSLSSFLSFLLLPSDSILARPSSSGSTGAGGRASSAGRKHLRTRW